MSEIPPFPSHLTPDERRAVLEKAVRDNAADMSAGSPDTPATLGVVAEVSAQALVATRWANDRIATLERQVAELLNERDGGSHATE